MHRVCSQLVISFQILSPSQRKKLNEFRIFEILIKNIFLFVRHKYSDIRFDALLIEFFLLNSLLSYES